jgi:hypothetical protein
VYALAEGLQTRREEVKRVADLLLTLQVDTHEIALKVGRHQL